VKRGAAMRWCACALLAWSVVAGCRSTGPKPIPRTHSRYDELETELEPRFRRARELRAAGQFDEALTLFEELLRERPDNILFGVWVQEVELDQALERGEANPRALLAGDYAARAEASASVADYVLAARLDPDPKHAVEWLERAEALDPNCAWVHYGRAFMAASRSDWPEARAYLARAQAADAGHLWARWLESWMLTREGSIADARLALERWLERAQDDPRIEPRFVAEAELDLALLCVLDGDASEADERLQRLTPGAVDDGRRLTTIAAVREALGDIEAALAAAQQASQAKPNEILPLVQQALLYDHWIGDVHKAEELWTEVLKRARGSTELLSVLESMRARVRLERARAASQSPKG
jgi:tetratricopeptide (TPR) repeat protein